MTVEFPYSPKVFTETDRDRLDAFILRYPLALVQSLVGDRVLSSMAPVWRLDAAGHYYFHLARANAHTRQLCDREVTCLFMGPNGYVSPRFYASQSSPPTWNYAVATVAGAVEELSDPAEAVAIIEQIASKMEGRVWRAPPEMPFAEFMRAICVFRLTARGVHGHFKLSQNKSEGDVAGVIRGTSASESLMDQELSAFMTAYHRQS